MNTLSRSLAGALLGVLLVFLAPFCLGLTLAFMELAMDLVDGRFRAQRLGGAFALAAGVSVIWGVVLALPAALIGGVIGGLYRRGGR